MRYCNRLEVITVLDYNWNQIFQGYNESGLSMIKFCEKNNIPFYTFRYHFYKNKRTSEPSDIQFVSVTPEATTCQITFWLNGNCLSFDSSLDDVSIARIIKAVLS